MRTRSHWLLNLPRHLSPPCPCVVFTLQKTRSPPFSKFNQVTGRDRGATHPPAPPQKKKKTLKIHALLTRTKEGFLFLFFCFLISYIINKIQPLLLPPPVVQRRDNRNEIKRPSVFMQSPLTGRSGGRSGGVSGDPVCHQSSETSKVAPKPTNRVGK